MLGSNESLMREQHRLENELEEARVALKRADES